MSTLEERRRQELEHCVAVLGEIAEDLRVTASLRGVAEPWPRFSGLLKKVVHCRTILEGQLEVWNVQSSVVQESEAGKPSGSVQEQS